MWVIVTASPHGHALIRSTVPKLGDDLIFGGNGNDVIFGRAGKDSLFGGDGDDQLFGNNGGDLLAGGLGTDDRVKHSILEASRRTKVND
jgi:hypothetical protein